MAFSTNNDLQNKRYHLNYHTPHQILWGFGIGVVLGLALYIVAEFIPRRWPYSFLGSARDMLLENPVSTWLQIRDGWGVWADGGREDEWIRWKAEWAKSRKEEIKND